MSKQHVLVHEAVMSKQRKKDGWFRPSLDYVNFLEMKNYVQKIFQMKFKI